MKFSNIKSFKIHRLYRLIGNLFQRESNKIILDNLWRSLRWTTSYGLTECWSTKTESLHLSLILDLSLDYSLIIWNIPYYNIYANIPVPVVEASCRMSVIAESCDVHSLTFILSFACLRDWLTVLTMWSEKNIIKKM